jgi:hypothetical protein
LYEQLRFADPADAYDDGPEDQEQQMVLSPERRAWIEELRRRIGERARETPKSKPSAPRGETAPPLPHPGYQQPR